MIQNKTITRLFNSYIKETNSNEELSLLLQSFDKSENKRLLKQLIRNELKSGFETAETDLKHSNTLSKSYRHIKNRIA